MPGTDEERSPGAFPRQAGGRRCRLWAISDLHVDHRENRELLRSLDPHTWRDDCLIVAGDVTDLFDGLLRTLSELSERFAAVAYVPGNHELWLPRTPGFADSWEKFHRIIEACDAVGVLTRPFRLSAAGGGRLWVVPLMSWYSGPEDDAEASLYVEKAGVVDRTHEMWGDYRFTRWPAGGERTLADRFLDCNEMHLDQTWDAPVVTFSHFLPRRELIFPTEETLRQLPAAARRDPTPAFNFSRVAGSQRLDAQLRALQSRVHVYGHQHRNRVRAIDGVTYVSHCMAYPRERQRGFVAEAARVPRLIWDSAAGFAVPAGSNDTPLQA